MFKEFVQKNSSLVMAFSVLIGLIAPGLEYLPKSTALIFVSIAIFFSCSNVKVSELSTVRIRPAALFYVLRFILLPVPLYFIALSFAPDYALGVLLITAIPVGATATSMAVMLGSNASLALSATLITNALAPIMMPFLIYLLVGNDLKIDAQQLFVTLILSIFTPAFFYFFIARRVEKAKAFIRKDSQFYSTLCIACLMAVVAALEKDYIMNNITDVLYIVTIGCILNAFLYFIGWLFARRKPYIERSAYMICSGVSNTGVAAGVALLYFSPVTVLFVVLAEVPWILGVMAMKLYADRHGI